MTTESIHELKPCPFCGGAAELDTMRVYRNVRNGALVDAVAVYCIRCGAEMSVCRDDVPGSVDDLAHGLVEAWNSRVPQEDAQ